MNTSRSTYIIVGAFVLSMVIATVVVVMIMTGGSSATQTYYTLYTNVTGLRVGSRVLNEGFPIGEISSIEPEWKDGQRKFRINMRVRDDWKFPADSEAVIAASGILAGVVIDVRNGKSTEYITTSGMIPPGASGNLLAAVADVADQLTGLAEHDVKPLLNTLNQTAKTLDRIMTDKGEALMAALLSSAENISNRTPSITNNIDAFVAQLHKMASDKNVDSIDNMVENFERSSKDLRSLVAGLDTSGKQINALIANLNTTASASREDFQRSMQSMRYTLSQVARSIDSITHNLDATGRNFSEFSRELRQNPSILLRNRTVEDGPGAN